MSLFARLSSHRSRSFDDDASIAKNSLAPASVSVSAPPRRSISSRRSSLVSSAGSVDSHEPDKSGRRPTLPHGHALRHRDVKTTDSQLDADIAQVATALDLFFGGHIVEAESMCLLHAHTHMYHSMGYCFMLAIKSLLSFDPDDLLAAETACKNAVRISDLLRHRSYSIYEAASRWASGSSSFHLLKTMSRVERHAELIHAEALLLKAALVILRSGDVFSLVREAFSFRSAYSIFSNFTKYLNYIDENNSAIPSDPHLLSGILLGDGIVSMIVPVLPAKVIKVVNVFGYTGNRSDALQYLRRGSSFELSSASPSKNPSSAVQTPICDVILLAYYLVVSTFIPVKNINLDLCRSLLKYNLQKYPNGTLFLYYQSRMHSTETKTQDAITHLQSAIDSQQDLVQLQHICYWDLTLSNLSIGNSEDAIKNLQLLTQESKWSKCAYTYAQAALLYQTGKDNEKATQLMNNVENCMQRIIGKSLPIEKFFCRKSKKFIAQKNRLMLPNLEFAYFANVFNISPRYALQGIHLESIEKSIREMSDYQDKRNEWKGGEDEFWDDWCLVHFLKGVIIKFIVFPGNQVSLNPVESNITKEQGFKDACESLGIVIKNANNLTHDHYLAWYAYYELGMVHLYNGDKNKAREKFAMVLSGRVETRKKIGHGKVSMQNIVCMRSSAALETIDST